MALMRRLIPVLLYDEHLTKARIEEMIEDDWSRDSEGVSLANTSPIAQLAN